jgi:SPP1 gp7 family putative phage head morphogenesis protein
MANELDLFVRQQVYIEGYKNGEAVKAEATLDEITAIVLLLSTQLGVDNLGDLTKRQMLAFVADVRAKVKTIFNKDADVTMANIGRFMAADITMTGKVLEAATGTKVPYSTVNMSWPSVADTPIPNVGMEPNAVVSATQAAILADITAKIKAGYADKQKLQDFARAIVGTGSLKFRDGLASKLKRRWATGVETIIQHTSSMVAFKLQSMASDQYVWMAILDSRTTEICRDRNGQVYYFSNGPRPPAHWRCRSFTVPATIVNLQELPTFYTWIKRQPGTIQDDVLGPSRGRELRAGRVKADDLQGFDRTRPLTVNEYADKLEQILTEVA